MEKISCPNCNHSFVPADTFLEKIKKETFDSLKDDFSKSEELKISKLKKDFDEQIDSIKQSAIEMSQKAAETKYELLLQSMKKQNEELANAIKILQEQLLEKDNEYKIQVQKQTAELSSQVSSLKLDLQKKDIEQETLKNEFALKTEKEILEFKKNLQKDMERILLEQRESLTVEKSVAIKEYEDRNTRLQEKINEMQRQLVSKDNEAIGEAFENHVENNLIVKFPSDVINSISKGVNGADFLIDIFSYDKKCGSMLIECKYADNWNNAWLEKAIDDKRNANADIVVLISKILPKGMKKFGLINNVFVVDAVHYTYLMPILRLKIEELGLYRLASTDRKSKVEQLFNYLSGQEFRTLIEHSTSIIGNMQKTLDNDKKVALKSFKSRQDDIDSIKDSFLELTTTIESKLSTFEGYDVEAETTVLLIGDNNE